MRCRSSTLAGGQCRALSWVPGKPAGAAHAVAASNCANARTPSQSVQMAEAARGQVPAPVVSGALGVAVSPGAVDAPQMLVVRNRATGAILHRWPLPDEVSSLAVSHGIAVLATVRHQGLYAVRLSDGRMRIVGPDGLARPARARGRRASSSATTCTAAATSAAGSRSCNSSPGGTSNASLDDVSTSYSAPAPSRPGPMTASAS